jgi:hypothetical protein
MSQPTAPIIVATRLLPWGTYDAVTFYPRIYVPAAGVDAALLEHEALHWERQRRMGRWKWAFKYITSQEFRHKEELAAYIVQVKAGGITLERAATLLSTYHAGRTYDEAIQELRDGLQAVPPPP